MLDTLAALADGPVTTGGLAERLAINERTARRLLQALAQAGWVERGPRFSYAATDRLRVLGARLAGQDR